MSASDPNTAIYLTDSLDIIRKKVRGELCFESHFLVRPFSYVENAFGLRQKPYTCIISTAYYLFLLFYRLRNTPSQVARPPRSSKENMELTFM